MKYLTKEEFQNMGFSVDEFTKLSTKAERTIDIYTRYVYHSVSFEDEIPFKREAVKKAVAFQIDYLNESGILSADDKAITSSMSIGRTSINYRSAYSGDRKISQALNMSLDAINILKSAGFGTVEAVCYDR